jgi:hypothetical protein
VGFDDFDVLVGCFAKILDRAKKVKILAQSRALLHQRLYWAWASKPVPYNLASLRKHGISLQILDIPK